MFAGSLSGDALTVAITDMATTTVSGQRAATIPLAAVSAQRVVIDVSRRARP